LKTESKTSSRADTLDSDLVARNRTVTKISYPCCRFSVIDCVVG